MLNSTDFVRDERLIPDAITAASTDRDAIASALAAPSGTLSDAAWAIAAGVSQMADAIPALIPLLDRDDLTGRAAAWALAQLDSEAAVVAAIADGGIDIRTHGYLSLAMRIALGAASATLSDALAARVSDEIERARAKRTGLGDLALKGLAMLGDARTTDLIQHVQEADPYTDKFELQRLRKAVSDGGRDSESIAEYKEPWPVVFADSLVVEAPAVETPAEAPASKAAAKAPAGKPPKQASAPLAPPPGAPEDADADELAGETAEGEDPEALPAPEPIDWNAFAESPEGTALPENVRMLGVKLGPLLEQLAARAIGAAFVDISGQEFAALLLQVLPQALPPQHVQAALSPQALHAYQGMCKWLAATGAATHGEDLLAGVKLVRQQLQAQIRQSGMLGGPDYSDPDDKPATPLA